MADNGAMVSVIIPIYNVEKYIRKCLESVVNQTWSNLEIICVNDGTKDSSMKIVETFAKKDSRIAIINNDNGGLSVARNTGMDRATGGYIYFLDSDDYLAEDAIEQLVKYAEEKRADVVYFNAKVIFETEEIAQQQSTYTGYYNRHQNYLGVHLGEQLFVEMINNWDFKPSAWLAFIKRSYLESIHLRFYPGIVHEDNLFSLQLIYKAQRAAYLDRALYNRIVREASIMTSAKGVRNAYGFFVCQREILTFLGGSKCSLAFYTALKKYLSEMKKNAVKALADISMQDIRDEIVRLDSASEIHFLDYIYEMYTAGRHEKGRLAKFRRTARRIVNRANQIIPKPVSQFCRLGLGFFIFRRNIKRESDKVCVSIVMPVYNVDRFIEQALESLIKQTLKNIEIICVDDGSTDDSKKILQEYQKKDSRIKVLHQEKAGAGAARNYGMSVAVGEYLLFLDSDDIFDEDLCEEVYYQSIRKKTDICLFGAQRYNMQTFVTEPMNWVLRRNEIPKKNLFSSGDVSERLFQITTGCPWSKMYRREFVLQNKLQFQNLQNTNDAFFVRMCLVLADRISTVDKYFVIYRFNEGNNIQSNKAKNPLAFYEAFKAIKLEMQKRGVYEQFERTYCNMVLTESLFNLRTVGDEDAQESIREKLFEEGIEFFGVLNHTADYYDKPQEYCEMQKIYEQRSKNK